nr:hypothetical protein [Actinomycetota bacterium]
ATSRVEAIVAAAETTAARLREEAEAEADRAREEAERTLRDARGRAAAESAEHLRRVQAATERLTELTEDVAAELGLMVDGVRRQHGSVHGRLDAVIAELEELGHGAAWLPDDDVAGGTSLPDDGVAGPAPPPDDGVAGAAQTQEPAPARSALDVSADGPPEAAPIARRVPSPSSGAPTVEYTVPGVDEDPPAR